MVATGKSGKKRLDMRTQRRENGQTREKKGIVDGLFV
jgi:hypothetical protein